MIAHVAQSGEDRGRVVLHIGTGEPHAIAVQAALRIARAFGSEIESLFVEDEQLFDCASYAFAREIPLSGTQSRPLSRDDLMRNLHFAEQGARRRIEELARKADVPLRCTIVRDESTRALTIACAERGPWNVVALAEPFKAGNGPQLKHLLKEVVGTTGFVIVGPRARRVTGPIVVAVEDTAYLPDMLRAAEKLAALDEESVVLLLIAPNQEQLERIDGETRLVVEAHPNVRIQWSAVSHGASAVVAETLRRLHGGTVVCRFGGQVVSDEDDLGPLAAALECPLFLVR